MIPGRKIPKRHPLTAINNPHIGPERLAGKVGHVAHIVAKVAHGEQPVEEGGPDGDPGHEAWVEGHVIALYNDEKSVVEEGNYSCNADDCQRLGAEDAEDDTGEGGGKESFVNAVEATGAPVHVENEGQSG